MSVDARYYSLRNYSKILRNVGLTYGVSEEERQLSRVHELETVDSANLSAQINFDSRSSRKHSLAN